MEPEGLVYCEEFINAEEERDLLDYEHGDLVPAEARPSSSRRAPRAC